RPQRPQTPRPPRRGGVIGAPTPTPFIYFPAEAKRRAGTQEPPGAPWVPARRRLWRLGREGISSNPRPLIQTAPCAPQRAAGAPSGGRPVAPHRLTVNDHDVDSSGRPDRILEGGCIDHRMGIE